MVIDNARGCVVDYRQPSASSHEARLRNDNIRSLIAQALFNPRAKFSVIFSLDYISSDLSPLY